MERVELVSWPTDPVETLARVWRMSRPLDQLPEDMRLETPESKRAFFKKAVHSGLPLTEMLNFVFNLWDVTIVLREQMVRHRIGVKYGDDFMMETFGDVHDSTWWSQSMRFQSMATFACDDHYEIPTTIRIAGKTGRFRETMRYIQDAYKEFIEAGVPPQDARYVIPLGATHCIAWSVNLKALIHICKKRSCWMAQTPVWQPIVDGIITELTDKIDPIFHEISKPPCYKGGKLDGSLCPFAPENTARISNNDPEPPCPIEMSCRGIPYNSPYYKRGHPDMLKRIPQYEKLWGEKIDV